MIYADKNRVQIVIPKNVFCKANTIVFTNQLTHNEISLTFEDVTPSEYFYTIDISGVASDFVVGQYDYRILYSDIIYNTNTVVASGILQWGDYKDDVTEYTVDKQIKTYERR